MLIREQGDTPLNLFWLDYITIDQKLVRKIWRQSALTKAKSFTGFDLLPIEPGTGYFLDGGKWPHG